MTNVAALAPFPDPQPGNNEVIEQTLVLASDEDVADLAITNTAGADAVRCTHHTPIGLRVYGPACLEDTGTNIIRATVLVESESGQPVQAWNER